ncbi:uncharacterized protein ANIA_11306 [Aspergillus nidulans FGSC A4]|uniref:Uncharacterized protein n=1 Tax=Emericella nidulans (strain FGSC A4 / ATCC 38163 / CBS 112.46 / NRRL 194 / M139) TaxID=227321 RepID=C8VMY0_EMENI|nr:hypothetical protein [Aspergillus nidulans FGSC A4]CBF85076.1 TPA: hypothetical protein ANIA_11306 [Aspergillus nidulans FGSC A4]
MIDEGTRRDSPSTDDTKTGRCLSMVQGFERREASTELEFTMTQSNDGERAELLS